MLPFTSILSALPEEEPTSILKLILAQFEDQLVLILLGSAVVSFVLAFFEDAEDLSTAFVEPVVILLILIANATVGVMQETSAEKAIDVSTAECELISHGLVKLTGRVRPCRPSLLQALKEYSPDECRVLRSSRLSKVHASALVPGDIVAVSVGDKIPADCRVISFSSSSFRVDQAVLTGESMSVRKITDVVKDDKAVKQDMINILFAVSARLFVRAWGQGRDS